MNLLSRLYSQPLMIEPNAWAAFDERNREVTIPDHRGDDARLCTSCSEPHVLPPRYTRLGVLELLTLKPTKPTLMLGSEEAPPPNDTAIVTFNGMIVKHVEEFEARYLDLVDLNDVDAALAHVAADANIRNVLLKFVNCPGGSVIGVHETAQRVYDLAQRKNLYTYSDSVICSAGVYIGSQASQFFVTASTFSGSIGVMKPPIMDMSKMLAANGITPHIVKAGKFKDTGTQLRPPTPEELEMLNGQAARMHEMFRSTVKRTRRAMRAEQMEGQVFFGDEAVSVGLADAVLPDLESALAAF